MLHSISHTQCVLKFTTEALYPWLSSYKPHHGNTSPSTLASTPFRFLFGGKPGTPTLRAANPSPIPLPGDCKLLVVDSSNAGGEIDSATLKMKDDAKKQNMTYLSLRKRKTLQAFCVHR